MAEKTKMLRHYEDRATPSLFLSNFFKVDSESFFDAEEVTYDIVRSGEDIALTNANGSGYTMVSDKQFTSKTVAPPTVKEAITVSSQSIAKRMPGENPYEEMAATQKAVALAVREVIRLEPRLRRNIEVQASQVLQTGALSLWNDKGVVDFALDYGPKATHFPVVGTAWDAAGADIAGDLESLADVIRTDGLMSPDTAIFGSLAFETALKNADFKARFEPRRAALGEISGLAQRPDGGQFRGTIDLGTYQLNVFTYGGRFTSPATGLPVKFVDPRKVTVLSASADLRLLFGAVHNLKQLLGLSESGAILRQFSGRLSSVDARIDMMRNAWFDPSGDNLIVGYGSKPLVVPCAIDTFGTLSTGIA